MDGDTNIQRCCYHIRWLIIHGERSFYFIPSYHFTQRQEKMLAFTRQAHEIDQKGVIYLGTCVITPRATNSNKNVHVPLFGDKWRLC